MLELRRGAPGRFLLLLNALPWSKPLRARLTFTLSLFSISACLNPHPQDLNFYPRLFFFFFAALLRYNSHTVYLFKVYNPMFFGMFTELCNKINFGTFLSPHSETLYLLVHSLFPPPTLPQSSGHRSSALCFCRSAYSGHFICGNHTQCGLLWLVPVYF